MYDLYYLRVYIFRLTINIVANNLSIAGIFILTINNRPTKVNIATPRPDSFQAKSTKMRINKATGIIDR